MTQNRVRYKGVRGFSAIERTATHVKLHADDGRTFWSPNMLITPDDLPKPATRYEDTHPVRRCRNCGSARCEGAFPGNPCVSE